MIPEDKKVEHMILLVGGNPLPNAVAGRLLVAQGGTISLVHSAGTADVAQRLKTWLEKQGTTRCVRLKQVEESSPYSILAGVQECLKDVRAQSLGLNYTGGTKVMAVHAYRALEQWAREQGITPVFSYLDARTLEMVFDPVEADGQEQRQHVGLALKLDLKDLLALHGWSLKHEPTRKALLPRTAYELAKACANNEGFNAWKEWIRKAFISQCRIENEEKWKSKKDLESVRLSLPTSSSLQAVTQTLGSELEISGSDLPLVHHVFEHEPKRFCEWLYGTWLEHHVLDILNNPKKQLDLHEFAQNIVLNEVEFQVDVIALRGYQLFAFSCSTDEKKGLLKLKLFEAYIRARQLGGDEARVALVCCSDNPEKLEQEMRRDVDPEGRIRVFGRKHFTDLAAHLEEWIRSQSGEG